MKRIIVSAAILAQSFALQGCGNSSPSSPSSPFSSTVPTATTPIPPASMFQIETLTTVYSCANCLARWTESSTDDVRVGQILLGVDSLTAGTTVLNNEERRFDLQETIDRVTEEFTEDDYVAAFDETMANLERYFNDADNDGWSVDGRHGFGRDWPHDSDGNDPDGWTSQIIIIVTRK